MNEPEPSLAHRPAAELESFDDIATTAELVFPSDPLERVIGQDHAIELARIAAKQRRHLLLVGPPGTGKSMIAQALALHLPQPTEELAVAHNPEQPERPFIATRSRGELEADEAARDSAAGELIDPKEAPKKVATRLGYRCRHCGAYSSYRIQNCPTCGEQKAPYAKRNLKQGPFGDLIGMVEMTISQMGNAPSKDRVRTIRRKGGKEEVVVYERAADEIRVLDEGALEKRRALEKQSQRKVLEPLERKPFVLATGASETELLGDVRHDPYGGHNSLGTPPYQRVVAGAIHDAHEGVLFIDELPHLGPLQRYILTAMQEKEFPIAGRNPQSAGASVRVDAVPCDLIFVGACNISDLPQILSPLRSRIIGGGYEILLETVMKDTAANRLKMIQFVAQEIAMDGRIPPATMAAIRAIVKESRRRAYEYDDEHQMLTLRLRELGGLVRTAGDLAVIAGDALIERRHVERALPLARSAEEQITERYGSYQQGVAHDVSTAQQQANAPYNYWNHHRHDDVRGYE